jgi:hypothetical protein
MLLTLQNYQYTADDFPPYFFERGLTKIIDTENSFQFKTYRLGLKFDMVEYKANIRPVLLKWGAAEYIPKTQSYDSSFLSRGMEENIKLDSYTGSFTKEIHVVTYQGRIEAVSYAENAEMQVPKIEIIAANPEGQNSLFFIIEFSTLGWCGFLGVLQHNRAVIILNFILLPASISVILVICGKNPNTFYAF